MAQQGAAALREQGPSPTIYKHLKGSLMFFQKFSRLRETVEGIRPSSSKV